MKINYGKKQVVSTLQKNTIAKYPGRFYPYNTNLSEKQSAHNLRLQGEIKAFIPDHPVPQ